MAGQTTFGDLEMAGQRRTIRRDDFLEKMDAIVPLAEWCGLMRPSCHSGEGLGRPPRGLETMRDDDEFCYGDAGYIGVEKREEVAFGPHLSSMEWKIACSPSSIKSLDAPGGGERAIVRRKVSVRSKAGHPFQAGTVMLLSSNLRSERLFPWLTS